MYLRLTGTGRTARLLRRSVTWKSCLRFSAALGVVAIVNLLVPDNVSTAVQNPMGAAAVIAFGLGFRRVRAQRAWNAVAVGVCLYALGDLAGAVLPGAGSPTEFALITSLVYLGSYLFLAVGITYMLFERGNGVPVSDS